MLIKRTVDAPDFNGRVADQLWVKIGDRTIARTRIRPANAKTRQQFKPPWTLTAAKATWSGLDEATQDDWNDFATSYVCYPIQGSPRMVDGETYFANYYTVELLQDDSAPIPSVPVSLVTWQTRPKFFEIAEWISDVYTLKAETDFDAGTTLLLSGLPPTLVGFKPAFQLEQIIGTHTFTTGLTANDTWNGANSMMAAEFGSIDSSMKIWGRVWEVSDGFCRVIKDPCGPDPNGEPPAVATSFDWEIYNDSDQDFDIGNVTFYDDTFGQCASFDFGPINAYQTETGNQEMDEGFDVTDLSIYEGNGYFMDMTPWGPVFDSVEGYEPFEISLEYI